MAWKNILVPFNFTNSDEKSLHYVISNFGGEKGVHVTLFHVHTPPPEIDGYNPALFRVKSTMASLATEARTREKELQQIVKDLIVSGFLEDQIHYVFKTREKSVGDEIVAMVLRGGFDTVVLSQQPGKATRAFTRNVHDKVISNLRNTTISIIT